MCRQASNAGKLFVGDDLWFFAFPDETWRLRESSRREPRFTECRVATFDRGIRCCSLSGSSHQLTQFLFHASNDAVSVRNNARPDRACRCWNLQRLIDEFDDGEVCLCSKYILGVRQSWNSLSPMLGNVLMQTVWHSYVPGRHCQLSRVVTRNLRIEICFELWSTRRGISIHTRLDYIGILVNP